MTPLAEPMMPLAERGAALLGRRLVRVEPMSGGDLSGLVRILLDDGSAAIVKDGPDHWRKPGCSARSAPPEFPRRRC